VTVREPPHSPEWEVEIIGPNNFFWKRVFFGPEEQDDRGDFIRDTVLNILR